MKNRGQGVPRKDHIGKKYNRLLILENRDDRITGRYINRYVLCECDCGTRKELKLSRVVNDEVKSCGCANKDKTPRKNYIGNKYGRLTMLKDVDDVFDGAGVANRFGLFRCDCGAEKKIRVHSVVSGHTKSCGCFQQEHLKEGAVTHGGSYTPEYRVWRAMISRCSYAKGKEYKNYGGRGITVSPRWNKFECFIEDMGERPTPKHSIDRIDNDGGYSPQNCRWATRAEQARNRSCTKLIEFNGKAMIINDWAEELGINKGTLKTRISGCGWTPERALTEPVNKKFTTNKHKQAQDTLF